MSDILLQLGLAVVMLFVAALMVRRRQKRTLRSHDGMGEAKQRSALSDKLRKTWRTAETILGILAIIAFTVVAFVPLAWVTITYWLGFEVPPMNGN